APLLAVATGQQSLFHQEIRAYQQSVACEGRQTLVRRVAISGRAQRQGLPPALSGLVEPVQPGISGWAHVTNPVWRWQGGYMQEDPGRSAFSPEGRKARKMDSVSHRAPFTAANS